jgi:SAM-dependent methyltransferase
MAQQAWFPETAALDFNDLVGTLRAIAEPTRLRLVALLGQEELTVTEITQVIGQSQPRVSRQLKLLVDAGILERAPEGAFVYYRLADRGAGGPESEVAKQLAELLPPADTTIAADLAALGRIRRARANAAAAYRDAHAAEQAALQDLYVPEAEVERAMLGLLVSEGPIGRLLDIGTGTGRILELLAPHTEHSVGLDLDHEMLQLARAALGDAQLSHASVRHGDLRRPPFEAASFDAAVMHHVLHLLENPAGAVADAARLLRPGGRLLVVDFAAHDLGELRDLHGHRHLGIAEDEIRDWAEAAGLELESERSLPPESPSQRLTVRLWLVRRRTRGPLMRVMI